MEVTKRRDGQLRQGQAGSMVKMQLLSNAHASHERLSPLLGSYTFRTINHCPAETFYIHLVTRIEQFSTFSSAFIRLQPFDVQLHCRS